MLINSNAGKKKWDDKKLIKCEVNINCGILYLKINIKYSDKYTL